MRETPPREIITTAPHSPPEKYHKLAPPIFARGRTGNLPPISAPRNPLLHHSSPHSSTPMFGAIVNREYSPQRAAHSPAHPLTHPPRSQPRPGQADCLPGAPAFQALTPTHYPLTTTPPTSQAEKVPVYLRGNGKYYYRACLACSGKALC